jgi:sulfur transfer complex TusBCD TusB component (DsrH family)
VKVLSIIACGYRATLEEQDDTVVWITQAISRAGADIDVLLRSSAVHYVVEGQAVSPLAIGGRIHRNAPDVYGQIRDLAERGVGIFVRKEDLEAYGLHGVARLDRAQVVRAGELAGLISRYDAVWHW